MLVRVGASSVNPGRLVRGHWFVFARIGKQGPRRPKTAAAGSDVAGRVEAVGAAVTTIRPGEEVFGTATGAWAEYASAREIRLAPKPAGISFTEAAALPIAGCSALQALRDHGRVEPGQKVLINGASGGVGTYAVQLAKSLGAHVTAVCSTRNVELARSLGADRISRLHPGVTHPARRAARPPCSTSPGAARSAPSSGSLTPGASLSSSIAGGRMTYRGPRPAPPPRCDARATSKLVRVERCGGLRREAS